MARLNVELTETEYNDFISLVGKGNVSLIIRNLIKEYYNKNPLPKAIKIQLLKEKIDQLENKVKIYENELKKEILEDMKFSYSIFDSVE